MNEIFLGQRAYGFEAAAQTYFGKSLEQLSIAETAMLAGLPQNPYYANPVANFERATQRQRVVLQRMREVGVIDDAQLARAVAEKLVIRPPGQRSIDAAHVAEMARRAVVERFGEGAYTSGIRVTTSLLAADQRAATAALQRGVLAQDRRSGWRGPEAHEDLPNAQGATLEQAAAEALRDHRDDDLLRAAIVLSASSQEVRAQLASGEAVRISGEGLQWAKAALSPKAKDGQKIRRGSVIRVVRHGKGWAISQWPEAEAALVALDTRSGRVRALVGGFDFSRQPFNHVTQSWRQPGSTIKPIVYSAALMRGMTPASIIVDGPFCVWQGAGLGNKCFRNFSGGNAGPQTMRWGLEQSRNLMTVRTASQVGMPKITETARKLGVGDYPNYLSIALGAGDTTVTKLTNAYAILANHGRAVSPTLIDFVQDRDGKVIFRTDNRCALMEGRCNAPDWDGGAMPRPPSRSRQLLEPQAAFQMVHIMTGVIERGTATVLRDLNRPLFGKTGTTSGPTNVWFVGGTPDVVAGTYIGYDQPRSLGGAAQGGRIAAPIFKQWAQAAFKDVPPTPFVAPKGIRMVRIDRGSGRRVFGTFPVREDPKSAVIWEAFQPESEPRRTIRRAGEEEELAAAAAKTAPARRKAPPRPRQQVTRPAEPTPPPEDFLARQGGIY